MTMQKHADPMSPRTQSFMGQPSSDDQSKIFEDGFNQMAYNVLVSKYPDLVSEIVTFKVLESDIDTGAAVGTFVLQHNNEIIYIPVVLADNQIKPLDMFYHKGLNVFLPLNQEWLNEVSQLTLDEMGDTVAPPKSLRRDIDTRHIMIPPTTGRYAYAAAQEPLDINADIYQMFSKLRPRNAQEKLASLVPQKQLLTFLKNAPNTVKEAFANTLTSRPKLAAQVAVLYGVDDLCEALRPVKEASATTNQGGALFVAEKDTPTTKFKEIFGDRAPEAFQGVIAKGYHAKDNRKDLKSAVLLQEPQRLTTPTQSGFYKVFTADGEVKEAFILHAPRSMQAHFDKKPEVRHGHRPNAHGWGQHNDGFIVVLDGGAWMEKQNVIAEPLYQPKIDVFHKLCDGAKSETPKVGDRGIFVKKTGQTFVGTRPFRIESITTDKDGVRRIQTEYHGITLVTDDKAAKFGLHQPKDANLMYIPADARFLKLKDESWRIRLLSTGTDVLRWMQSSFDSMGAGHLAVKNAGGNQVSLDGNTAQSAVSAMKTAALNWNIHFEDAEELVKQALAIPHGKVTAYLLTPAQLEKVAQSPMMDPTNQEQTAVPGGVMQGMPQGTPQAGPGAMPPGGDPSQMSAPQLPPPPPPPSPLDIAVGEAHTQINQQVNDLQQQQMALQDKAQTIVQIQQRAQEIATNGPMAIAQGAPPMTGGQGGGMPPQGGGMPPQGGGMPPQGMPPQGMPQGQPGMPGPDPNNPMAQPTVGAMMSTETPSSAEVQQQINPQFLEQAANLQDTGAFDAAAIGSMSRSPSFRNMVTDYVPTLERALDNLGRVLLTMWMQESELKTDLGDENYADLEDNNRAVFEGLGKLVLQLNKNATLMEPQPQPA